MAAVFKNCEEIKGKCNVLGKIVVPRIQLTIQYILSELEEREREEFFRLKRFKEKKTKKGKKTVKVNKCRCCSTKLKNSSKQTLCDKCRSGGTKQTPSRKNIKIPKPDKHLDGSSISAKSSLNETNLGYFEKQFKKIIKFSRHENRDGTVNEEKQVITIRTKKRTTWNSDMTSGSSFRFEFDHGEDEISCCNKFGPRETKSDDACRSSRMIGPQIRSCLSAGDLKDIKNKPASTQFDCSCSSTKSQASAEECSCGTSTKSNSSCCESEISNTSCKSVETICNLNCSMKDACTNTKRSDRYDTRPLRMRRIKKKVSDVCSCLSDPVMGLLSVPNVRKCISFKI